MAAMAQMLVYAFLVGVLACIYPFPPFRTRGRAALFAVGSFIAIAVVAPKVELPPVARPQAAVSPPVAATAPTGWQATVEKGPGTATLKPPVKTYTPQQLTRMVRGGRYPPQGAAQAREETYDFVKCLVALRVIRNAISAEYPYTTVTDTDGIHVEKVWVNDAAMTLSCVASTRKLVITTAPYL